MDHHFATVRRRITQFTPKCSAKIIVCQSIQNLLLINLMFFYKQPELDTCHQWRHVLVSMCKHLWRGEDRLLFPTLLSHQTVYLTYLIWIPWITQFGVLFSSWYIVKRSTTLTIRNKSQTVANAAIDQWSKRLRTNYQQQSFRPEHTQHRFR